MARDPQNANLASLTPVSEAPDALQVLVRRADDMAMASLAGFEQRGLTYLQAGHPVHLRGPAGSGKTRLALRIAEQSKWPIVMLVGDASFDTKRLVGGEAVTRTRQVVDRTISSVIKVGRQTDALSLGVPVSTLRLGKDGLPGPRQARLLVQRIEHFYASGSRLGAARHRGAAI